MYPYELFNQEYRQAKQKLADSFKAENVEPPMRSPKTSITLAWARWQQRRSEVVRAFRSINRLASKVRNTEQEWVKRLICEIEAELTKIKNALSECGGLEEDKEQ